MIRLIARHSVRQHRMKAFVLLAAALCLDVVAPAALAEGAVPTIEAFKASPAKVLVGRSATLTWSVSNATRVAISHGVGVVTRKKEVAVRPVATTRYFITATNANGSVTKAVVVSVTTSLTSPSRKTPPPASAAIDSAPSARLDASPVVAHVGNRAPQSCSEWRAVHDQFTSARYPGLDM